MSEENGLYVFIGAVTLAGMLGMHLEDRYEHAERMAMVERGLVPSPKTPGCSGRVRAAIGGVDGGAQGAEEP